MITRKIYLFLIIFHLCVLVTRASDPYKTSWTKFPPFDTEVTFHKKIARRIANSKIISSASIEHQSNVAAFGLTLSSEGRDFCIEFPNLFYSSYGISETEALIEPETNEQIIAVSDLFRGTPLTTQTQKHQLCSFILWLLSKPYIPNPTGLIEDLTSSLDVIQSGNAKQFISIKNGIDFKVLHHFLHCEQLFLYKMLTEDYIIDSMVHQLLQKKDQIFNSEMRDIQFFLEICTYNDMCTNCFLSMHRLIGEIQEKIGQKLLYIMTSDRSLTKFITKCLPVKLKLRISSFRPFKRSRIGDEYDATNYLTYFQAKPTESFTDSNIIQFFNPWIPQYLLLNRFQRLSEDLRMLTTRIIMPEDIERILNDTASTLISAFKPYGLSREDIKIPSILTSTEFLQRDIEQSAKFLLRLVAELFEIQKLRLIDNQTLFDITKTLYGCEEILHYPDLFKVVLPKIASLANVNKIIPNEEFFINLFWINDFFDSELTSSELDKLPEELTELKKKIISKIDFSKKFILPLLQETNHSKIIYLFQNFIINSKQLNSNDWDLIYKHILSPKIFSILDQDSLTNILPSFIDFLQNPNISTRLQEQIGEHIRKIYTAQLTSKNINYKDLQQQITQLKSFPQIRPIAAAILDQTMLLDVIKLSELAKPAYRKIYNFSEIHRLCQNIQRDIFNIDSGVLFLTKDLLQGVKENLDKITWIKRDELTQSKNILQQILTSY